MLVDTHAGISTLVDDRAGAGGGRLALQPIILRCNVVLLPLVGGVDSSQVSA